MSSGVKLVSGYLWKTKKYLIPAFIFIILSAAIQSKIPTYTADVANKMVSYLSIRNITTIPSQVVESSKNDFTDAAMYAMMMIFVMGIFLVLQNRVMAYVAGYSTRIIRKDMFKKLQTLSIRYFDSHSDGEVMSRFSNDIDNISNLITQTFTQLFANVIGILFITVVMYQQNPQISTFIVFMGLLSVGISVILAKRSRKYIKLQQEKLGILNGYLDERISGQKLIYAYNLDRLVHKEFSNLNNDYKQNSIKGQVLSGLIMPTIDGISLITLAITIFASAYLISSGQITLGILIAFSQFVPRFFQPLSGIASQFNILQLGFASASRVAEVLAEEVEIKEAKNPIQLSNIKTGVELKNVTFAYDKDPILKNINLKVNKGQKVALVGPTGSGKSTIMNLLNRFYDINDGEVLIDGINIKEYSLKSLRKNVGIILQESVLFSGTIRENIAFARPNASEKDIEDAAKQADIHDYIITLPEGYDTLISNTSSVLSTGQKQLISIARTMLANPEFLILDEATSNVDTITEEHIQKAMKKVLTNRTSFVIAHRLKTILDADVIVVLKDGEIIEKGSHKDLMKLNGFYAELYHNQFVTS
jgi:ATP-binding cassette subfamily B multidrug efflux pump